MGKCRGVDMGPYHAAADDFFEAFCRRAAARVAKEYGGVLSEDGLVVRFDPALEVVVRGEELSLKSWRLWNSRDRR